MALMVMENPPGKPALFACSTASLTPFRVETPTEESAPERGRSTPSVMVFPAGDEDELDCDEVPQATKPHESSASESAKRARIRIQMPFDEGAGVPWVVDEAAASVR